MAHRAQKGMTLVGDGELDPQVFRSVLDRESIGVGLLIPIDGGSDFRHVYVNPAFQALKPFRTMPGRSYTEVWPELARDLIPRLRTVLETGTSWIESESPLEVEVKPGLTRTQYYTFEYSRLALDDRSYLCKIVTEVSRFAGDGSGLAVTPGEHRYRELFNSLIDGFAHHEIVVDEEGNPVDYVFLEVNEAFEELSGLKASEILGKRVTEVIPGIENDPADWIGTYGRVALEGEPARFEQYAEPLGKWYSVSAYRPGPRRFVTVFDDITQRKRAEEERDHLVGQLADSLRALKQKDRAIRQAYSDVIDAVTGGRLVILSRDELDRAVIEKKGVAHELREPAELSEARAQVSEEIGEVPQLQDILLVFSEGATNMLKHAGGGVYRVHKDERRVQIVLQDEGPGIDFRNLPKAALVAGFSTQQTLGMGFTIMMELLDRLLLCTDPTGTMLLLEKDLGVPS